VNCQHRRSLIVALLTMLSVAGCGSRVAPQQLAATAVSQADAPVSEPAGTAVPSPESQASEDAGEAEVREAAKQEIRQQDDALNARGHHNQAVRATVAQPCIPIGETQVIHVTGPPRATFSLAIGFSDGQAHGATAIQTADDQGRYDWQVKITPDIPPGHAVVLLGSSGPDNGPGGGSGHTRFQVADYTGQCQL